MMGGGTQRIEVLLVGLMLLLVGAVAAALMLLPAPAPAYLRATPLPLSGTIPAATSAPVPTRIPLAAPVATRPQPARVFELRMPRALAPWLLLAGAIGLLLVRIRHKAIRRGGPHPPAPSPVAASEGEQRDRVTNGLSPVAASEGGQRDRTTDGLSPAAAGDIKRRPGGGSADQLDRGAIPPVAASAASAVRIRLNAGWYAVRIRLNAGRYRGEQTDCASAVTGELTQSRNACPEPFGSAQGKLRRRAAKGRRLLASFQQSVRAALRRAAQLRRLPASALPGAATSRDDHEDTQTTRHRPDSAVEPWSAEDRAVLVAETLAARWDELSLRSPILALDTPQRDGAGEVIVAIAPDPAEEEILASLPDRMQGAFQRMRWRGHALDTLEVTVAEQGAPPAATPMLAPALDHRRGNLTRFLPLDGPGVTGHSRLRHLGIYGGAGLPALHAILGSLLYMRSPATLALAILDHGEITPLYRDTPHYVPLPGDARATLDLLLRALRAAPAPGASRPLLLVVVEPDEELLGLLAALLTRLRQQPGAPLHLLLAQSRLEPSGREIYATLPAIITAGGHGPPAWLPGQGGWPAPGRARLVGRGGRVEGRPRQLDEAAIAALLATIRGAPGDLPPVVWDEPDSQGSEVRGQRSEAMQIEALSEEARWLDALLNPIDSAAPRSQPEDDPDNGWPAGPGPLRRRELAELMAQIIGDPALATATQQDQAGLTKRRLTRMGLLPEAHAGELAETLMLWFDSAGILTEPAHTRGHRFRQPRPLARANLDWIAERLRETPIPAADAVRAAWTERDRQRAEDG